MRLAWCCKAVKPPSPPLCSVGQTLDSSGGPGARCPVWKIRRRWSDLAHIANASARNLFIFCMASAETGGTCPRASSACHRPANLFHNMPFHTVVCVGLS